MRINLTKILSTKHQIFQKKIKRKMNKSTNSRVFEEENRDKIREKLKKILTFAVESVKPGKLIETKVKIDREKFQIYEKSLKITENVYMIGFGKAVLSMATQLANQLGDRLIKGIISIPRGSIKTFDNELSKNDTSKLDLRESSLNNEPDNETLQTTHDILDLIKTLDQSSTLIVLISGGGSALLSSPVAGVSINEKLKLCRDLFNSGADIKQVNKVRQKLSQVKGGGLAQLVYPVPTISLILSDIVGDPMDLIASGPTVFSPKSPDEVMKVLRKHKMLNNIDEKLRSILTKKESIEPEYLNDEKQFSHVDNFIIGNNSLAVEAAKLQVLRMQLNPFILFNDLQGLVPDIALMYAKLCSLICRFWEDSLSEEDFVSEMKGSKRLASLIERTDELFELLGAVKNQGLVLIAGGEPSVVVSGTGKGGRNQELALTFAINWYKLILENPELELFNVMLLSGGTDGQDGPTDAAGAFGYSSIVATMEDVKNLVNLKCKDDITDDVRDKLIKEMESIDPENVVRNNDSYSFYSKYNKGKDLIKIGLTGTNVMDLNFIYIKKKCCFCKSPDRKVSIDEKCRVFDEHNFFTDVFKVK